MARVARVERTGGPEVITWLDVELPAPGEGEVLLRNTAIGLNFIDIYFRSGTYKADLPFTPGSESVGVIEAVGPDVSDFSVGDRVGTNGPERGAYASARIVKAAQLYRIPDAIDDRIAATLLLKGATAEYLVERCAKVQAGQTVLVHAAAGGLGLLLVAWLKAIGATVIGTVGTPEKARRAKAVGADHIIEYKKEDIAERVRAITDGAGVPVVFDGVGKAVWDASLQSTSKRGLIVSYGNASGVVEGVALGSLSAHGSLFVTRPTLFDYYATPEERSAGMARVFAMVEQGAIKPEIGHTFALEDAAEAQRMLEAGETEGATVLVP